MLRYRRGAPRLFDPMPDTARQAASVAADVVSTMRYLADLSRQWPKVNSLAFEIRQLEGHKVYAVEYDVRPGEQVVLGDIDFFSPRIVVSGHGRVVVRPTGDQPQEVVVSFEPCPDGQVALRFDSLFFGLVRFLAFPLKDARLREFHYASGYEGDAKVRQVDVLLEEFSPGDPRTAIRVTTSSAPSLRDRPGLPPQSWAGSTPRTSGSSTACASGTTKARPRPSRSVEVEAFSICDLRFSI